MSKLSDSNDEEKKKKTLVISRKVTIRKYDPKEPH